MRGCCCWEAKHPVEDGQPVKHLELIQQRKYGTPGWAEAVHMLNPLMTGLDRRQNLVVKGESRCEDFGNSQSALVVAGRQHGQSVWVSASQVW